MTVNHRELRKARQKRIRGRIFGTAQRPRLSVFRSNRNLTAQIVDDHKAVTLLSLTTRLVAAQKSIKSEQAYRLGLELARQALAKGIKQVVFDRGGYLYHGRVAALAKGAREGGLSF